MLDKLKQILAPIRYWDELPLRELDDRPAITQAPAGMIPPVVIQTWEDRLFGKTHLREMAAFRALNPELSFELWDRDQRLTYMREKWGDHAIFPLYQKSLFGPMKTDIFRYCLMADRGGFYFDISKGCTVPLHTLYSPETEALITFEPTSALSPANPPSRRISSTRTNFSSSGASALPRVIRSRFGPSPISAPSTRVTKARSSPSRRTRSVSLPDPSCSPAAYGKSMQAGR